MGVIRKLALAVTLAAMAAALAAVFLFQKLLLEPYQGYAGPVVIELNRGAGSREMARRLEQAGVIRSRWLFLAVRAMQPERKLLAGEYRFDKPLSVWDVFQKIARGDVHYYSFTVPEGFNRFEAAEVAASTGVIDREEFLYIADCPDLIQGRFPEARSLEGFLFPDTYQITRHATAEDVVRMMLERFLEVFDSVTQGRESKLSPYKLVTLASLIEKETGREDERKLVSSVFHNRLERGMLLQCDPTVIYGLVLDQRYRGKIYESDLEDGHPYNTYVHAGLPPGPIANPGRASLEAALAPADSEYLYFVAEAEGAGRHVFSKTLAAHNRAVAEYRASQNR